MMNIDWLMIFLLVFCGVILLAAFITKARGGLFLNDYSDPVDNSIEREQERDRGVWFANWAFKWTKYVIGGCLLLINSNLTRIIGLVVLLGSFIYDQNSKKN